MDSFLAWLHWLYRFIVNFSCCNFGLRDHVMLAPFCASSMLQKVLRNLFWSAVMEVCILRALSDLICMLSDEDENAVELAEFQ